MKKHKIIYLALLLSMQAQLMAQYITLKGKQFYDQSGEPFYPVICNYELRLTCDDCDHVTNDGYYDGTDPLGNFQLHPFFKYGSTNGFDEPFDKGTEKIKADFIKMKEMGFNTVRLLWFTFMMMDHHRDETPVFFDVNDNLHAPDYMPGGGGKIICESYSNPRVSKTNGSGQIWYGHPLKAAPPYHTTPPFAATDNLHKIFFPKMHELLDIANEVGIHVILVTGGNYVSNSQGKNEDGSTYPNAAAEQASEYAEFMSEYALMLKDRSEILAYDLFNEPIWWMDANGGNTAKKKSDICTYTKQWYDAIKAQDPNHLVTMSGSEIGDLFNYDPAVTNLDFYSVHFYPDWYTKVYENRNRALAMERVAPVLHYINKTSSIPWVVTETGVSSCNYTTCSYPAWGTYALQATDALALEQNIIDQGASGFGWWEFQDHYQYTEPIDIYGLLKPGNPATSGNAYVYDGSLEKALVDNAFTNNTVVTRLNPGTEPTNYYNPFGGNPSTNYTVTGTIVDQNNAPVRDAVIFGGNPPPKTQDINGVWQDVYPVPPAYKFEIFTFSHADGTFEFVSPIGHVYSDPQDPTHSIDYSKFTSIHYSAPAANTVWTNGNQQTFPALTRQTNVYDNNVLAISSPIDNTNSPYTHTARHTLTVQNVTIANNGIADFHASMEVDLMPGFEAVNGSETEVYIAPVDFTCNVLVDAYGAYKTDETKMLQETELPEKSIEVQYTLLPSAISLLPNPATDFVYVKTDAATEAVIDITDYTGSLVYTNKLFINKSAPISVGKYAAGCYFVKVNTNGTTAFFKLIINR